MPNGDSNYELCINGLEVIALPNKKEVPIKEVGKEVGKHDIFYSLDLKDIPKNKRYLKITIKRSWR